jgi:hypothetical protein
LRVEVRIERSVDRFEVLQAGAEFHVEPLGDHLEQLAQQFPFPRRQARVLQHLGLEGRRLDRQEVFPPVQKLQAAPGSLLVEAWFRPLQPIARRGGSVATEKGVVQTLTLFPAGAGGKEGYCSRVKMTRFTRGPSKPDAQAR